MAKSPYFLASRQFEAEVAKWLQAVSRGESVSVLFVPKTDRFVRLGFLLNDKSLMEHALGKQLAGQTILQRMDFDAHDVEELDDLHQLIAAEVNFSKHFSEQFSFAQLLSHLSKNNLYLVVIIPEAEKFLTPDGKTVLSRLSYMAEEESERIRVISFFEKDVMHPSLALNLPSSSYLYENVYHYPLYSEEHTRDFIRFLESYWSAPEISHEDENRIIEACGGHFWLVKEAIRSLTTAGSWSLDDEGTVFRLRTIYNLLLPAEQNVIQKLTNRKKIYSSDERLSLSHLRHMNLISKKNVLLVGGFDHYLSHHLEFKGDLSIQNNRIVLNQIPIEGLFSRKEKRIMRILVARKNNVVSRDDIARSLWPTNTSAQYSDWAIDQIVARIRKRLTELSIPSSVLVSIRGRGYSLQIL